MGQVFYEDNKVRICTMNDNGLAVESKISDPAELSVSVDADKVERNLGKVRFDIRRSDGVHEEYAYIMGQVNEQKDTGLVYIATRSPGQQQSAERMRIDHNGAIFSVPIIGGPIISEPETGILKSSNGRLILACQDDGNFVLYKDGIPIKALFGLPSEMLW